eukprot:jgi/Ulvmu1/6957/UM033_0014.1
MIGGKRASCAATCLLQWLSLLAHLMRASGQTFTSQRAAASLCNTGDCLDFELVLADFGVYPYGQLLELSGIRFWQPNVDPEYPSACGGGIDSFCQYGCDAAAYQTDDGPLSLEPQTALGVLRSFDTANASSLADCSFIDKVEAAKPTGAATVIILNERDNQGLTMDTNNDNLSLDAGSAAPPTFLMERIYVASVRRFINATVPADQLRFTIDMRNMFPQAQNVTATVWYSRLWQCADHGDNRADCQRRVDLFSPSPFTTAMSLWLRTGRASLFLRQPQVDRCRPVGGGAVVPEYAEFCSSAGVQQHCIHQKRYCQPDPDGQPDAGTTGRDALVEMLRTKCVDQIGKKFRQEQHVLSYVQAWQASCLEQGDLSNDCSVATFRTASLQRWSAEVLRTASSSEAAVLQELSQCVDDNTAQLDADVPNAFFEADAADDAMIAIDPTVEINGGQLRGAFEPGHITAALCSGFTDGSEPASCLDFSPEECTQGSEGFTQCSSGYFAAAGRTSCQRTFEGFECRCPTGHDAVQYDPTPEEAAAFPNMTAPDDFFRCIDSNECSQEVAACAEGSVCLDLHGGFRCVDVEEQCTESNGFGGCYISDLPPLDGGSGSPRTACVSRVSEYRARAAGGDVSVDGAPPFNCSCAALPCHAGDGTSCEQLCPLEECLNRDNPAISTCVIAPESRDLTVGPVSAATVIGIAAGICLLLLLAGLLLAMRYHRQNRDRLIDLDALVRQLTLGSEGTPGTHPSPHTPQGRMVSVTPSSMYTNAAFQASRREAEAGMLLSPRDGRSTASTAPGAIFSGGPSRPFGSVSGLRDSPPARRTIRPPAPGHVPLSREEVARSYSTGGAIGEDTSATHMSAAMDALGSQSSAGERVVWRSSGWARESAASSGAATGATATLDAALDTQSSPGIVRGHLDTALTTLPEAGVSDDQFADASTMRSTDAASAAAAAAAVEEGAAQRAEQGAANGVEVELAQLPTEAGKAGRAGRAAEVDPMSSQTDGEFFSIMSSFGVHAAEAMMEFAQQGQVWATVDSTESSTLSRGLLGIGGAIEEGGTSEEGAQLDEEGGSLGGWELLSPGRQGEAPPAGGAAGGREKLWMSIESGGAAAQSLEGDWDVSAARMREPEAELDGLLAEAGASSGSTSMRLCKEGFSSPVKQTPRGRQGAREGATQGGASARSCSRGSAQGGRMEIVDENPRAAPLPSVEGGGSTDDSPSLGNTFPSTFSAMRGDSLVGDSEAGRT